MTGLTWLLESTLRRISPRNGSISVRRNARPTSRKLQMETLDGRLMMSATPAPDWFSKNLPDATIASMVRQDYTSHSAVTRDDMLSIFTQVDKDGTVTANELTSLQTMSRNAGAMGMPEYVRTLLSKVAVDDPANRVYQYNHHSVSGHANGDLYAGSTSAQLDSLVNKWFKGSDLPTAIISSTTADGDDEVTLYKYKQVDLPLSVNGFSYADVDQGEIGDCTLMASVAEVAARKNSYIQNMFIDNKDGTYTVRLYAHGVADYVTVNKMLPAGGTAFAHVTHSDGSKNVSELWVALAEKAIVQENASGYVSTLHTGVNAYSAIDDGDITTMKGYLYTLTGLQDSDYSVNPTNIADAMKQGKLVLLGTGDTTNDPHLITDHCYAVVNYDASSSRPFTIFNPWGILSHTQDGQTYWGQVTAAAGYINKNNFDSYVRSNAGENFETFVTSPPALGGMTASISTAVTARPMNEIGIDVVQPVSTGAARQSPEVLRFDHNIATVTRAPKAVCVDELMANWDFGMAI